MSATRTEMGEKHISEHMLSAETQLQHQIWMRQQSRTITSYSWMLLRSKGRKCTIQLSRFPVSEAIAYFCCYQLLVLLCSIKKKMTLPPFYILVLCLFMQFCKALRKQPEEAWCWASCNVIHSLHVWVYVFM